MRLNKIVSCILPLTPYLTTNTVLYLLKVNSSTIELEVHTPVIPSRLTPCYLLVQKTMLTLGRLPYKKVSENILLYILCNGYHCLFTYHSCKPVLCRAFLLPFANIFFALVFLQIILVFVLRLTVPSTHLVSHPSSQGSDNPLKKFPM